MIRFLLLLLLLPGAELLSNHTDELEESSKVSLGAEDGTAGATQTAANNVSSSSPTPTKNVSRFQQPTSMAITPSAGPRRESLLRGSSYRRTATPPGKTKSAKKTSGPGGHIRSELPGERVPAPDRGSNTSMDSTNFAAGTEAHAVEADLTSTRKQIKVGLMNPAPGIRTRKREQLTSGMRPATQLLRPPRANALHNSTSLKALLVHNSSLLENELQPVARVFSNATSAKTPREKENRTENSIFASQFAHGKKTPLEKLAQIVREAYGRLRDTNQTEDMPMTSPNSKDNDIPRPLHSGGPGVPEDGTSSARGSGMLPDVTLLDVSSPEPVSLERPGIRTQSQLELNANKRVLNNSETKSYAGLEIHSHAIQPTKVVTQTPGRSAPEASVKIRAQERTSMYPEMDSETAAGHRAEVLPRSIQIVTFVPEWADTKYERATQTQADTSTVSESEALTDGHLYTQDVSTETQAGHFLEDNLESRTQEGADAKVETDAGTEAQTEPGLERQTVHRIRSTPITKRSHHSTTENVTGTNRYHQFTKSFYPRAGGDKEPTTRAGGDKEPTTKQGQSELLVQTQPNVAALQLSTHANPEVTAYTQTTLRTTLPPEITTASLRGIAARSEPPTSVLPVIDKHIQTGRRPQMFPDQTTDMYGKSARVPSEQALTTIPEENSQIHRNVTQKQEEFSTATVTFTPAGENETKGSTQGRKEVSTWALTDLSEQSLVNQTRTVIPTDLSAEVQSELSTPSRTVLQTETDLVSKIKPGLASQTQPAVQTTSASYDLVPALRTEMETMNVNDLDSQTQLGLVTRNRPDLVTQTQSNLISNSTPYLFAQTQSSLIEKSTPGLVTQSKPNFITRGTPEPFSQFQPETTVSTSVLTSNSEPDLVTKSDPLKHLVLATQSQPELDTKSYSEPGTEGQSELVTQTTSDGASNSQTHVEAKPTSRLITEATSDLTTQAHLELSSKNHPTLASSRPAVQTELDPSNKTKTEMSPTQPKPDLTTQSQPRMTPQKSLKQPQEDLGIHNEQTQATQTQEYQITKTHPELGTWAWPESSESTTEDDNPHNHGNRQTETRTTERTDVSGKLFPPSVAEASEDPQHKATPYPSQPSTRGTMEGDSTAGEGSQRLAPTTVGLTTGRSERLPTETQSTLWSPGSPQRSNTPRTFSEMMSVRPGRERIFIVDEQLPVFKVQTINVTYRMNLKGAAPTHCQHPETCRPLVLKEVTSFYKSVPGFHGIELPNITWDKALIEYRLHLSVQVGDVMSETQELVLSDPTWLFESSQVTDGVLSSRILSVSLADKHMNPCRDWFSCPAGFECASVRKVSARCLSPCHGHFCHNHGICIHRDGRDAECQCPVGRDFWYMGQTCDYRMTHHRLAAIACGVVFCIIVCAAAAVFMIVRRFQTQILQQKVAQTQSSYRRFSRFDDVPTHFWCPSQTWLTASASLNSLDNPAFSSSEEVFPLQALGSCVCGCQDGRQICPQISPPESSARDPPRTQTSCSSVNDIMIDSGKASDVSVSSWPMEPIHWTPFPILHQLSLQSPFHARRPHSYFEGMELVNTERSWTA